MGVPKRHTAVLDIRASTEATELLALDVQRRYSFILTLDGRQVDGGPDFRSPIGDEAWRAVVQAMREATEGEDSRSGALRRQTETVKDAGRTLYRYLGQLSPELQAFLTSEASPRRLVISSRRPEIHVLPWEAMIDEKWRSVAETDVSVVHGLDNFDERPLLAPALRVEGFFGPGTEARTRPSLERLAERARGRGSGRIIVNVDGGGKGPPADAVHVEAHGDAESGELDLARRTALETPLVERLQSRTLVLLWSCFSAMVHSWGESLGMKLHRQGNAFVLAFATPLRYDTSADLADRFYESVLGGTRPLDPESAVVEERSYLYREHVPACEWAALTLWLRAPIDLSKAVLDGPRLLPAFPKERRLTDERLSIVRDAIRQCLPGRPILLKRFALDAPLTEDLFEGVRGAVVHLRADAAPDGMEEAINALGARPRSAHRGDRLLAILDALEQYPGSILVWSGVSARPAQAVYFLESLPASLAVVFISPWQPRSATLAATIIDGGQRERLMEPPASDEITQVELLVEEAGKNRDAIALARALVDRPGWAQEQKRRLHSALYWALVRIGEHGTAEAEVGAVGALDRFEGLLLAGNLAERRSHFDEARDLFEEARKVAGNDRDRARAQLELGYLAGEASDPALAERLLSGAIEMLEGVRDEYDEPRWTSALGRALRDLADLLAVDTSRAQECESLLRRALLIHHLDGRDGQVGAVLKTRGILERARGRWEKAESAFAIAVGIFDESGNLSAWAGVIREMADLAFRMEHYARVLEIVRRAKARIELVAEEHGTILGRLAVLAARAHWRLGSLEQAREACEEARGLLLPNQVREWQTVCDLLAVIESLPTRDEPRPAARSARSARDRSRRP